MRSFHTLFPQHRIKSSFVPLNRSSALPNAVSQVAPQIIADLMPDRINVFIFSAAGIRPQPSGVFSVLPCFPRCHDSRHVEIVACVRSSQAHPESNRRFKNLQVDNYRKKIKNLPKQSGEPASHQYNMT